MRSPEVSTFLILLSQSSQLSYVTGNLPVVVPSNVLLLSSSIFEAKTLIRHWSDAVLSIVWETKVPLQAIVFISKFKAQL